MIPGWPYSVVAALEPGRTSWTAVLDAVRLGPDDDETAVTAAQVREVITRLIAAGHWRQGDPPILVVFDAGYDVTRLAFLLADLPVRAAGPAAQRPGAALPGPAAPARHRWAGRRGTAGSSRSPTRPPGRAPHVTTTTETTRYGTAVAPAWDRLHPRLDPPRRLAGPRRPAAGHRGHPDPAAGRSPARRPGPQAGVAVVVTHRRRARLTSTGCWQAFLRRFDLEHTFRLFKQVLGWTAPKTPRPGRRRPVDLADHRRPRPAPPRPAAGRRPAPALGTARPARAADPGPGPPRVSEHPRDGLPCPAGAPKPGKPGPGRPPGSKNRHPAPRHDVGKTTRRERIAQGTARTRRLNGKLSL